MTDGWDIQSAISLYNVDRWGSGYFSVNSQGHIQVLPMQGNPGVDIMEVIDEARSRMPVDEVSIGDYVLAGGEAAVLVMVEAIGRLLPGVLGNEQ